MEEVLQNSCFSKKTKVLKTKLAAVGFVGEFNAFTQKIR